METRKPLNHIPGYEASSKGNIRNSETGYILNPTYRNDGYRQVTIRVDGVRKSFYVHRLVWEAFNGDLHKHEIVVHDNCLSDDDRLENLTAMTKVWDTSLALRGPSVVSTASSRSQGGTHTVSKEEHRRLINDI